MPHPLSDTLLHATPSIRHTSTCHTLYQAYLYMPYPLSATPSISHTSKCHTLCQTHLYMSHPLSGTPLNATPSIKHTLYQARLYMPHPLSDTPLHATPSIRHTSTCHTLYQAYLYVLLAHPLTGSCIQSQTHRVQREILTAQIQLHPCSAWNQNFPLPLATPPLWW